MSTPRNADIFAKSVVARAAQAERAEALLDVAKRQLNRMRGERDRLQEMVDLYVVTASRAERVRDEARGESALKDGVIARLREALTSLDHGERTYGLCECRQCLSIRATLAVTAAGAVKPVVELPAVVRDRTEDWDMRPRQSWWGREKAAIAKAREDERAACEEIAREHEHMAGDGQTRARIIADAIAARKESKP